MKKSDLQNGMVVLFKKNERTYNTLRYMMVMNGNLIRASRGSDISLSSLDDDMKSEIGNVECVYMSSATGIDDIFDSDFLTPIYGIFKLKEIKDFKKTSNNVIKIRHIECVESEFVEEESMALQIAHGYTGRDWWELLEAREYEVRGEY